MRHLISKRASLNSRLVEFDRVGDFRHRYEWSNAG